jgi:predicted transcriptional regulator
MARKARKESRKNRTQKRPNTRARPKKKGPKPLKPRGTEFLDPRLSKALAHWMRVNIMAIASWRKISPSEFARETGEHLGKVSYHFKRLVEYGVIELVGTEQVRGSTKHFYKGTRQAIFGGASWAELPKSVQDGVAGAALQDFMKVAVHSIESGAFSVHDESYLVWEPHLYDDLALKAAVKILESTRQRLAALAEEAAPRLLKTGEEGMLIAVALSAFEMGKD